jgi:3-oxoacyl-[acyl-carrier-protein] synthase III
MNLMIEAYITGVGAYLPGEPVGNIELAARFGDGSPRGAARCRRGARGERDQDTALCRGRQGDDRHAQ